MREVPPIELLTRAAEALGDLCHEVVFLGGAIVGLLVVETGGLPPRFTKDVDIAFEVSGYMGILELDRRLLSLGFRNDINGPVCRYLHGSIIVDVIPVIFEAPGNVNSWYPLAIETAQVRTLPNGIGINVIEPVCFLGTKLTAFRSSTREHHDDIFLSRDFGDMMRVIDGRPKIAEEVSSAPEQLRDHLRQQFAAILDADYIEEAIAEHVGSGREILVIERIRGLLP